jgi:DNA transposition AAA+ family ATPase
MKQEFVRTENAVRFRAEIAMLEKRGALEAGWLLVTGRPGEGKTKTLHNWAAEVGAVMLTAQANWTVTRMMEELAAKLGIEPVRGYQAKVAETIGAENMPIVLDEAQFALHDAAACLEVLRGITDKSGTILVAVTMDHEVPRFNRREQIGSRFFRKCQFHESTLGDVGAACQQLAEGVRIGDDLVERIHRETGGRMRLVLNAISRVEQIAHHLKAESLAAEAVASIALCEDFQRAGVRRRAGA